ncbi:MAG: winged helix-turn-helix domain-containing protein [Acidobacteriota bacterium]|nr:winged helix-turn-helix domain-containing protein [Acidobacteriota bacterium]
MRTISNRISHIYEFGEFRFDAEKRVLWRGGDTVLLPPKAIDVLAVLIAEHGELVERDQILSAVWQDTFVEEGNLNNAVSALRKVLGEDGSIQTVPRRGYRFAANVREVPNGATRQLVIEKRTLSDTVIEEREEVFDEIPSAFNEIPSAKRRISRAQSAFAAGIVLLLLAGGAGLLLYGPFSPSKAARSAIKSIAVLPLKSFSRNTGDEELRLRITDALITRLGGFENIVVPPTNSVLKFSGEMHNAVDAGRELGVDAVLEGRVQEEAGRLRVTLQLISAKNGDQLWSEQFDGQTNKLLALQDTISSRLRRDFSLADRQEQNNRTPVNSEAYEAYLKGRFLWNQRKRESYFAALDYFQKSIDADPNFAAAYTGISDSYHLLQQRNVLSTEEAFAKAETAAQKALELDPASPEAHTSMGSVSFVRYSRWTEAEQYFRGAIELNPSFAEPYARLGMLLNAWGRFEEAYEVLKKAESLDPTSVNNAIYLGAHFYFTKQYDRAELQFRRILEFAPGTERAHFFLARIYELNGRYEEAFEHHLKEREISRSDTIAPLRQTYQTNGIRGFWLKQIEFMKTELKDMHNLENHIASRYVLLGDTKNACDYVEKNLEKRGSMRNYGRVDPLFDSLRSDPRFVELMQRFSPEV